MMSRAEEFVDTELDDAPDDIEDVIECTTGGTMRIIDSIQTDIQKLIGSLL